MTNIDKARLENFLDRHDWYEAAALLAQSSDIDAIRSTLAVTWRRGDTTGWLEGYEKGKRVGYNELRAEVSTFLEEHPCPQGTDD